MIVANDKLFKSSQFTLALNTPLAYPLDNNSEYVIIGNVYGGDLWISIGMSIGAENALILKDGSTIKIPTPQTLSLECRSGSSTVVNVIEFKDYDVGLWLQPEISGCDCDEMTVSELTVLVAAAINALTVTDGLETDTLTVSGATELDTATINSLITVLGDVLFQMTNGGNPLIMQSSGNAPPYLYLQRSGGTIASPTVVNNNNRIGGIGMGGYDGSDWNAQAMAEIRALADENWSTTAQGTRLEFYTTPDGTVVPVMALVIHQDARLEIDGTLDHDGSNAGFFGTAPTTKPTISGSRGGNAALASLLTGLAGLGLVTDSTSA